jgi:8-oxo-dGTP diphosphatase
MNEDCFHLGVKALIRNKEGKLLLLQINKKELINEPHSYWDIPGGRIKRKQSIEKTLIHEIKEETGIKKITKIKPFTMVLSNIRIPKQLPGGKDVGLILSIYVCGVSGDPKIKLSKEHIDYGWFEIKKASKLLEYKYPREFTHKLLELGEL